jgi:hypothetical protein
VFPTRGAPSGHYIWISGLELQDRLHFRFLVVIKNDVHSVCEVVSQRFNVRKRTRKAEIVTIPTITCVSVEVDAVHPR